MKLNINRLFIPALAVAAMCMTACRNEGTEAAPQAPADLISFRNVDLARSFRYVNSAESYRADSDVVVACKAELLLPVDILGADITTLQDSILHRAFVIPDATIANCDSAAVAFFRNRCSEAGFDLREREVHPDSIDDFYTRYNGYVSVNINPVTLTSRVLAMQTIRGQYEPYAAHGIYSIWYVNYDLNAGRIISLEDIVKPEGIAALPKLIRKQARAMSGYIGPTQITGLPADRNFYINARNELVFAYQPYEVASYAQGEVRVAIPAYRITQYLTPEGTELLF
ncbi:MAG: RsiV family protein [Muribaculaceae bacterium]|nr:RsiV family protein [Muribaculaceae bacterium]